MDVEINVGLSILPNGRPAYLATVKKSLTFHCVMGSTPYAAAERLREELADDGHTVTKVNHIEY